MRNAEARVTLGVIAASAVLTKHYEKAHAELVNSH